MVASGRGAQHGVLFKDASAIEALRDIDTLVVDKTGTLTEGKPALTELVSFGTLPREHLLALAAALERPSEHPLARAIVAAAEAENVAMLAASDFRSLTGCGVSAKVDGSDVALGNAKLMDELHIAISNDADMRTEQLREQGATVMFLAIDGALAALLAVADRIKSGTPAALKALHAAGLKIALRAEGRSVAMAGDGINDAPALVAADIGIAMGSGTDVAMESAQVTLVKGELGAIVRARTLSQATVRNIHQNLFFAFVYNAVGVPLAAGALFPWFGITLSPMIAALAMSLSSVSVVSNALRLRNAQL
jgi:Cu+-exporting ATPase